MSHALQLTPFDHRYLEAAALQRRTRSRDAVSQEEGESRARIVRKAVARAGNRWRLHLATGIPHATIGDWMRGRHTVPLDRLATVEAYLSATEPCQKRQNPEAWCPSCSQHVPASQMRDYDGERWIELERCKSCLRSTRIVTGRARAAAQQQRRHCQ